MMLRKALVLGTACTMMLCSGAVFAQDIAQTTDVAVVQETPVTVTAVQTTADFAAQLAAAPENAAQLIAQLIIDRQLQKIKSRAEHRSDTIDDEGAERW